jgi:hypothetical protein
MIVCDLLCRFGDNREKWVGDTWNDQPDRLGPLSLKNARGLIWLIIKFFDYGLDPRQRFLADTFAAVDYP